MKYGGGEQAKLQEHWQCYLRSLGALQRSRESWREDLILQGTSVLPPRGEIFDFVQKGFWVLLPWRLFKHKMESEGGALKQLWLAPLGVIPQWEWCPWLIIDYTLYALNQETLHLAPKEAMQSICLSTGKGFCSYQVRNANSHYGPVYLGKLDLVDGFCWVWLMVDAIPQLVVSFPKYLGEEQLVGMPLTLWMGWLESFP